VGMFQQWTGVTSTHRGIWYTASYGANQQTTGRNTGLNNMSPASWGEQRFSYRRLSSVSPEPPFVSKLMLVEVAGGPFTYDKSGEGIMGLVGSGADVHEAVETGGALSAFVGSGGREKVVSKDGGGFLGLVGSGSDAVTHDETGGGILGLVGSGVSEYVPAGGTTYDKAGGGVMGLVGSGVSAYVPAPVDVGLGGGGDANAGRRDFSYLTARRSEVEMRHLVGDLEPEDLTDLEIVMILLA